MSNNPLLRCPSRCWLGQSYGTYTLISAIGHGGMGSVWLAHRNDGRFERKAAVKLLNLALMGQGGEERFKREGRILGQLSHPHIAELFDAGVSSGGRPYLVFLNMSTASTSMSIVIGTSEHRGENPSVARDAGRSRPRCAHQPGSSSRPQALQCTGHQRRPGEAAGLWHCQAS